MSSSTSCKRKHSGFSLLEVVIAVAIFSTGLGGFALLLLMSIQDTASSGLQTLAVSQARSLAAELELVPGMANRIITPVDAPACLEGGVCAPEQIAGATLYRWQKQVERRFPEGAGTVCHDSSPDDGDRGDDACDGAEGPVVKIFWSEPGSDEQAQVQDRRVTLRMPLP